MGLDEFIRNMDKIEEKLIANKKRAKWDNLPLAYKLITIAIATPLVLAAVILACSALVGSLYLWTLAIKFLTY